MNPEHKRIVELAAGWEGSAAVVSVSPADATLLESVGCPVTTGDGPGKPKRVSAPDLCEAARKLASSYHETPPGAAPTPNQQSITGPGTDPDPNDGTRIDDGGKPAEGLAGFDAAVPAADDGEPEPEDGTDLDPTEADDDLDDMTVAELKEAAEAENIDITGHHKKADIVAAIKLAREQK